MINQLLRSCSSAGQSSCLLSSGSRVRVPPGSPSISFPNAHLSNPYSLNPIIRNARVHVRARGKFRRHQLQPIHICARARVRGKARLGILIWPTCAENGAFAPYKMFRRSGSSRRVNEKGGRLWTFALSPLPERLEQVPISM